MFNNRVSVQNCQIPTTNEPEIKFKPSKTITGEALKEFSQLPGLGISALNPKYSFFIIGVGMLMKPDEGGYLSGFDHAMGFLLVASSPVVAIGKAIFSISAIGAGAIGTAILAPSYAIEKGVRVAINSDKLNDPQLKRKSLIKAFAKRMAKLIERLAEVGRFANDGEGKRFMVNNPQEIAMMSAICLAFLSKDEYGESLIMGDGKKIKKENIEMLDPLFQNYFTGICEIRDNLRAISNSRRNESENESWVKLMSNMDALSTGRATNLTAYQLGCHISVNDKARELARELCEDRDFVEAWTKLYPNYSLFNELEDIV